MIRKRWYNKKEYYLYNFYKIKFFIVGLKIEINNDTFYDCRPSRSLTATETVDSAILNSKR